MTWAGSNRLRQCDSWCKAVPSTSPSCTNPQRCHLAPIWCVMACSGLIYSMGHGTTDLCDSTYSSKSRQHNLCLTTWLSQQRLKAVLHSAVGWTGLTVSPQVSTVRNKIYLLSMLDFIWILLCVLLHFFILSIIENPGSCPFHWWHCGRVHGRLNLQQRYL